MLAVKREKGLNDDSITSKMALDIQKPMNSGIIPIKYVAFSEKNINDSNYGKLWEALQKIEERYKKKINYKYRYEITDWESELCYEQGRFIENVEWTGRPIIDIPDTQIPYCTYSKMKYQQLKYYLYWRSCFRKGETIETGYRTFYYLCVYELLAEFGPFSPLERLEQLERLYKNFKSSLSNAHWIREYANFHGLEIHDKIVKGWADWGIWERNDSMYEIIQGNYAGVFDVMYKKSAWKFMKNSFIEKTKCVSNIAESVVIMMPKLEKLFADAGITFTDFLVGKMKKAKHHVRAYEGSVWNECVVFKFGIESTELISYEMIYPSGAIYITDAEGNIERKTNTHMNYCDPYLSEYILKYTEMLFRKEVGYNFITMPTKLKGALKVKFANGYEYVLSADVKLRRDEKIYFTLYDDIERIIISSVKEYMNNHPEEIATIKERFNKEDTSVKLSFQKKVIPVDERMMEFIGESNGSKGEVERLIGLYNEASLAYKKAKARKFACWMWDYWILHINKITYSQLKKTVQNNKWNITGIQALQERRFKDALPYLRLYYNPCAGIIAKKIDERVIADGIIIILSCIDQICKSRGIDFIELLLGKFDAYDWVIYDTDERIKNNITTPIVKNVGNVEIYQFDPNKNIAIVNRHSYSQDSTDFIVYLLKNIDNHYRSLIGYTSFLNISFPREKFDVIQNIEEVMPIIDDVITIVTKFTFDFNRPIFQEPVVTEDVQVTDILNRKYLFARCSKIEDVSAFVKEKIKEYYGNIGAVEIKSNRTYEVFELDLNNFDIHNWTYRYKKREKIKQGQTLMQLYHFYDIYGDISNRLMTVKKHAVEYNPNFNFLFSKVFKDVKGMKDLNVLSALCDDATDFMQWIEWVKRGKFVYTKSEPYIQILFYFIANDWILSDNHAACLVMMCEIWNYCFKDKEKHNSRSDLYLEWIKDYWMIYCSDEVTYEEFKSLFVYDIEFYNNNGRIMSNKHFIVDMDTFDERNLLQFYNENCDYHVLEGTVVKKGYKLLLEDAIEAVHISLKKLWEKYGLNFMDYFHIMDEKVVVNKTREVFYRAILTEATKRKITKMVNKVIVSDVEKYICEYDTDRDWPIFKYQSKEISNASSRLFMEYIIKLTEKGVREWLNISYKFKFDEKKLLSAFPNKLFKDNVEELVIESTIMNTVACVCNNSGIMKGAMSCKQVEYDLIERDQRVDKDSIEKARMVLKKNQERLVVDNELFTEEKKTRDEKTRLLSSDERDFLKILLDGGEVRTKINELEGKFISVSLLIESINNKAIEEIGDSIIEEGDEPYLVEDYLIEAKEFLGK